MDFLPDVWIYITETIRVDIVRLQPYNKYRKRVACNN